MVEFQQEDRLHSDSENSARTYCLLMEDSRNAINKFMETDNIVKIKE